MLIEVIATTIEDVREANEYGADRIELCSSMEEDGLTPSIGLIKEACRISQIPVNVMVRNHNKSFVYDDVDKKVMSDEISFIKQTEANGIVIGMLNDIGHIDEPFLKEVVRSAGEMEIVFHKAFDQIEDKTAALKMISQYSNIKTVLTAGGKGNATSHLAELYQLNKTAKQYGIVIMPGGGLKYDNIKNFKDEFSALHFGTGVREDGTFKSGISYNRLKVLKKN
jgi:copper homeostasis protein